MNIEQWLKGLGTTCALNSCTAHLPANQDPVFRQTMENIYSLYRIYIDYKYSSQHLKWIK